MPTTLIGAPYPALSDSPNGATQIQSLAEWTDDKVCPRFANTAERDQKIPTPVAQQICGIAAGDRLQMYASGQWHDVFAPLADTKSTAYRPGLTQTTADTWQNLSLSFLALDIVVPFSGSLAISVYSAVAAVGGSPGRDIHISFRITDVGTGTEIIAPDFYKGAMQQKLFVSDGQRSIFRRYVQSGLSPSNTVKVAMMGRIGNADSGDDGGYYVDSSLTVEPFRGTVIETVT